MKTTEAIKLGLRIVGETEINSKWSKIIVETEKYLVELKTDGFHVEAFGGVQIYRYNGTVISRVEGFWSSQSSSGEEAVEELVDRHGYLNFMKK